MFIYMAERNLGLTVYVVYIAHGEDIIHAVFRNPGVKQKVPCSCHAYQVIRPQKFAAQEQ